MASKHLNELLNEDQEPFVLNNYIHDKLKRSTPKTHLHLNKRKPISQNSSFSRNFCKNACFLSTHSPSPSPSPDVRKSPLFDFKSPCRNNSNTLFVHIPARTAALLLEAALRIQKNSSLKKTKSRKVSGFGLFGSILKRITNKKRNPKNEFDETEKRVSVKDIIRWDSSKSFKNDEIMMGFEEKQVSDVGCSCSYNSRRSSVWSESNEEKSFDLESSSSRSEDSEDMEFVNQQMEKDLFCSSPFRFVLHNNNLSPCRSSPSKFDIFGTPKRSPTHNNQQVVVNENGSSNDARTKYEEDDKEQNSPVSVFDPPFEDDDYQEDDDEHNFTDMQRAKQQLLQNLRRFERLAEFDPVDLEKRIADQEDEDREVEKQYEECCSLDNEKVDSGFVRELLTRSNMYNHQRIPSDMKSLVLDLVAEEAGEATAPCSRKLIAEKVCKRLESWKEVEYNTIDMMVEFDFRRDADDWAKHPEQMRETAVEIEVAIFGFLMEELSDELV